MQPLTSQAISLANTLFFLLAPIVILVAGIVVYIWLPSRRRVAGMFLTIWGGFELLYVLSSISISIVFGFSSSSFILPAIMLVTGGISLFLGIKCLYRPQPKMPQRL